jgi:isoleucyl-tRNA synthetase
VVLAEDVKEKLGTDLLRLYYCYDIAPWETQKFSLRSATILQRVINVLWNIAEFAKTYCSPGKVASDKVKLGKLEKEDRWIVSKANALIKDYTKSLEDFRFHDAGRQISEFVLNDFSRWYIKLIRDRVSPNYNGDDKEHAQFSTLYALETVVRLLAPVMPFITEKIYREVFYNNGKKKRKGMPVSVHFSSWPETDTSLINKGLNKNMALVMDLVEATNAARQASKAKLRWPVQKIEIQTKNKELASSVRSLQKLLFMMTNSKRVVIVKNAGKGAMDFEHGKLVIGKVLVEEAMLRELTRRIQLSRKKEGLLVQDRISITIDSDQKTEARLKKMEKELLGGTGASSAVFSSISGKGKGHLDFRGSKITFSFRKK